MLLSAAQEAEESEAVGEDVEEAKAAAGVER